MFFLGEKLGKTVSEIESQLTQRQVIEYHAYYDPNHWQTKIQSTPEGRAMQIKSLILGKANG